MRNKGNLETMDTKKPHIELSFDIVLFIVGVSFISLFYMNNILLTVLLALLLVFVLKFWCRKNDIYFFVFGAVIGMSAEVVAVHFGAWQYANPSILEIPVWLPIAWGLVVVLIRRITYVFVETLVKQP
ncbi:MAG: hypothetical protein A7315_07925 [Candidatus Altiarchaeales archaeon WOR_SM1_79]|nr:MAG: hypothetical protein A7315_07925 [Candidatus Altiarchaeales archaeon WOR_SM1_79]